MIRFLAALAIPAILTDPRIPRGSSHGAASKTKMIASIIRAASRRNQYF
jgi:hypothetical protein